MPEYCLVLVLALVVDAIVGDPAAVYRRIPHPVVLAGAVITCGENWLHRGRAAGVSIVLGAILVLLVIAISASAAWLLQWAAGTTSMPWLLQGLAASTLFAGRGLYDHVRAVEQGLVEGLEAGRVAVAQIVGRDPESLDEAGIARAAIESVAENFSDGLVAPAFWLAVLGLPGLFIYKAVNTLDSMIGHRNERYLFFGRCAARLDDAANFLPARLAGVIICLAALALPGASGAQAARTMWRDASGHRSVNAGWQEAAFAGALGLRLAGPRQYGDELVDDAWMGSGRACIDALHVRAALRLYLAASVLLVGIAVACAGWEALGR